MSTHSQHIILIELGKRVTQYYHEQLTSLKGNFTVVSLSTDFEKINALLPDKLQALKPTLEDFFTQLDVSNDPKIVIPNITLHLAIDKIETLTKWKPHIVHPIHLGIEYLQSKSIHQVTVVGSAYTMQSTFFKSYFEKYNINALQPTDADMFTIDEYRKHIYHFGVSQQLQLDFNELISKYESPIIACTELTLINSFDSKVCDLANLQLSQIGNSQ